MSVTGARRPSIAVWPAGRRALSGRLGGPGLRRHRRRAGARLPDAATDFRAAPDQRRHAEPRGEVASLTLNHYLRVLTSPSLVSLLANTLGFALGSCVLALFVGGALAWIVERTNTPLRRLGYGAAFMAFAMPYILYTIAWLLLLGKGGPINAFLMSLTGASEPLLNVYSLWGMILVEGFLWSPLVFLMLAAVFRAMDPALEEAALMSGAGLAHGVPHLLPPGPARYRRRRATGLHPRGRIVRHSRAGRHAGQRPRLHHARLPGHPPQPARLR